MEMYLEERSEGPLETLIFKQLNVLIDGEKMLEKRYRSLHNANQWESSLFETEVLALRRKVDRLQRMIEAMGCAVGSDIGFDFDPIAA